MRTASLVLFFAALALASPTTRTVTYADQTVSTHTHYTAGGDYMDIPEAGPGLIPYNDTEGGYRDPPSFSYPIPVGLQKWVWDYDENELRISEWDGAGWVAVETRPFTWSEP